MRYIHNYLWISKIATLFYIYQTFSYFTSFITHILLPTIGKADETGNNDQNLLYVIANRKRRLQTPLILNGIVNAE